jgi:hypothetical protein
MLQSSYDINPWPALGQTHKYGGVKRCMRAKPLLITGHRTAIHMMNQKSDKMLDDA